MVITLDRTEVVTVTSFRPLMWALLFSLVSASGASAQIMIDVARITCKQFLNDTITVPDNIAYWLGGYYDGRLGNTEFDVAVLKHNVSKLEDYCLHNQDVSVMDAVETLLHLSR